MAHEIWETKGHDLDKEITRHLRFNEQRFAEWYQGKFSASPPSRRLSDPLCFFDTNQILTITIDVWAGEKPGELSVKLDGDEGEIEMVSVGASMDHPGTHEVVLRHRAGTIGRAGIELISAKPGSKVTKYYDLEFRSKLEHCSRGAHFEVKPQ